MSPKMNFDFQIEDLALLVKSFAYCHLVFYLAFLQVIHDELLVEEIEMYRSLDKNQIPPPLEHFHKYLVELKTTADLNNKHWPLSMAASSCTRDLFHFARISGLHVLECVMNTVLSAIKRENIEEATDVRVLFYV